MRLPTLQIIIVNWNSGEQLRACLKSIAKAKTEDCELARVVVVDNASADGSADNMGGLPFPLAIIRNRENRGFAAACNQGAKSSRADYLLFLNPDTTLRTESLDEPVRLLHVRPDCGICGIQLLDSSGKISRSCARFPNLWTTLCHILGLNRAFHNLFKGFHMVDWSHAESREVDHVIGAFYLVHRELFDKLGGFDERFFVYLEDLDFSLRARQAGYASYYLASASAFHKGGGTSENIKARRLFYSLRSRVLYAYKHFSFVSATVVLLGTLFVEPLSRLVLAMVRRSGSSMMETLSAYGQLWRALPSLVAGTLRRA